LNSETGTEAFFGLVILPPKLIIHVVAIIFSLHFKYREHPFLATFSLVFRNSHYYLFARKFLKVPKDI
jgi:hypothetical protein